MAWIFDCITMRSVVADPPSTDGRVKKWQKANKKCYTINNIFGKMTDFYKRLETFIR